MRQPTVHLVSYVAAIRGQDSDIAILARSDEQERWQDQGFEVLRHISLFHFHDGTVIRRTLEQDVEDESVDACPECWISYEVIQATQCLSPTHMTFNSHCRENVWLKYHLALIG